MAGFIELTTKAKTLESTLLFMDVYLFKALRRLCVHEEEVLADIRFKIRTSNIHIVNGIEVRDRLEFFFRSTGAYISEDMLPCIGTHKSADTRDEGSRFADSDGALLTKIRDATIFVRQRPKYIEMAAAIQTLQTVAVPLLKGREFPLVSSGREQTATQAVYTTQEEWISDVDLQKKELHAELTELDDRLDRMLNMGNSSAKKIRRGRNDDRFESHKEFSQIHARRLEVRALLCALGDEKTIHSTPYANHLRYERQLEKDVLVQLATARASRAERDKEALFKQERHAVQALRRKHKLLVEKYEECNGNGLKALDAISTQSNSIEEEVQRILNATGPYDVLNVPRSFNGEDVKARLKNDPFVRDLRNQAQKNQNATATDVVAKLNNAQQELFEKDGSFRDNEYARLRPLSQSDTDIQKKYLGHKAEFEEAVNRLLGRVLKVYIETLTCKIPQNGLRTERPKLQKSMLRHPVLSIFTHPELKVRSVQVPSDHLLYRQYQTNAYIEVIDATCSVATVEFEITNGIFVHVPLDLFMLKSETGSLLFPKLSVVIDRMAFDALQGLYERVAFLIKKGAPQKAFKNYMPSFLKRWHEWNKTVNTLKKRRIAEADIANRNLPVWPIVSTSQDALSMLKMHDEGSS